MTQSTHYVYGSGFVGCLYDNGPNFAPNLDAAIDGAMDPFTGCGFDYEDQAAVESELKAAVDHLYAKGIHYFSAALRPVFGADYVEVTKQDGPCPYEDD